MNVRKRIRQLPVRLAVGSYVINSGLSLWNADEITAKELQAFAAGTYPFLAKLHPQLFVNALVQCLAIDFTVLYAVTYESSSGAVGDIRWATRSPGNFG
jgi:hypothetical protein